MGKKNADPKHGSGVFWTFFSKIEANFFESPLF